MNEAIQTATVASVLIEWARHECLGRHVEGLDADANPVLRNQLREPARRAALEADTDEGRAIAMEVFLQFRFGMLVSLFAAEPIAVVQVSIAANEVDRLGYLEHPRLAAMPMNDFIIGLVEGNKPLVGRVVGVASDLTGRIQLIDGLHRGRAWLEAAKTRAVEPLPVSVIVTARPSAWERP